jgi:hypothetical protein
MRFPLLLFFALFLFFGLNAQEFNRMLNQDYDYEIEKSVYSLNSKTHTSIRPFLIKDINMDINTDSLLLSQALQRSFQSKFWQLIWDKSFNEHVIDLKGKDFLLQADPLFNFELGVASGEDGTDYVNTRGFQLQGMIGDKVGFYSSFYENQASYPEYIDAFIRKNGVVPGQGRPRSFGDDGYDFSSSEAYVSYSPAKHFNFQFGHGKNFWGDGYRSLLLSDNSFNYPFLKVTTSFWRIKYVNLYAQFQDYHEAYSAELGYQRKYGTFHYLSINISKRLNLSLFEAIIWEARDSTGTRGFDVNYLNPVIFYRPVEFSIGSPDNALMGLNLSLKIGKQNVAYGQLLLDEFKLSEVTSQSGWWANKQAFQLGFKSFDAFKVSNLYLQAEFNYVRPFTYAHRIPLQAYGHYGQSLAHPLGANFMEIVGRAKYHHKRYYFEYKFSYAVYGEDEYGLDYGGDIFIDFDEHAKEYNNFVGQGLRTYLMYNDFRASFLVNPAYNLNFSIGLINRMQKTDIETQNMNYFYFAFRTSIGRVYYDF